MNNRMPKTRSMYEKYVQILHASLGISRRPSCNCRTLLQLFVIAEPDPPAAEPDTPATEPEKHWNSQHLKTRAIQFGPHTFLVFYSQGAQIDGARKAHSQPTGSPQSAHSHSTQCTKPTSSKGPSWTAPSLCTRITLEATALRVIYINSLEHGGFKTARFEAGRPRTPHEAPTQLTPQTSSSKA